MFKKIMTLGLVGILSMGMLVGCGCSKSTDKVKNDNSKKYTGIYKTEETYNEYDSYEDAMKHNAKQGDTYIDEDGVIVTIQGE